MSDVFARYMDEGFDLIDGWPGQKSSVRFMTVFEELFEHVHEHGGVCEIGIHHAKYIIALHNILRPAVSLGIDLFEDQIKNFSDSGRGERAICEENIAKYAYNPGSIKLMSKDSLDLKAGDLATIIKDYGYFSMFSVDGGHSALHSASDFLTASRLTSGKGIIIMDDIFHPDWPGVTEGVYTVLASKAIAGIEACKLEIRPGLSNVLKAMSRIAPQFTLNQMANIARPKK